VKNAMYVEIHIKGNLKPDWSDWLEGLIVSTEANGETVLKGEISDQAALLGLLNRIHGLNLQLLSFSQSDNAPSSNVKF
jgi:haloalkane dehalogenase